MDVLWQDIDHTANKEYFAFDESRYSSEDLDSLSLAIEADQRRLVVITDPHIRAHPEYAVYTNGTYYEADTYGDPWTVGPASKAKRVSSGRDFTSIFVKTITGVPFEGDCWPGKSVWFDFMNGHAQAYWKHLMLPEVFKGTNYLYNFWIDMNEPSVFG